MNMVFWNLTCSSRRLLGYVLDTPKKVVSDLHQDKSNTPMGRVEGTLQDGVWGLTLFGSGCYTLKGSHWTRVRFSRPNAGIV
jgi:hypothetical protein